jgi:hypothetical protein
MKKRKREEDDSEKEEEDEEQQERQQSDDDDDDDGDEHMEDVDQQDDEEEEKRHADKKKKKEKMKKKKKKSASKKGLSIDSTQRAQMMAQFLKGMQTTKQKKRLNQSGENFIPVAFQQQEDNQPQQTNGGTMDAAGDVVMNDASAVPAPAPTPVTSTSPVKKPVSASPSRNFQRMKVHDSLPLSPAKKPRLSSPSSLSSSSSSSFMQSASTPSSNVRKTLQYDNPEGPYLLFLVTVLFIFFFLISTEGPRSSASSSSPSASPASSASPMEDITEPQLPKQQQPQQDKDQRQHLQTLSFLLSPPETPNNGNRESKENPLVRPDVWHSCSWLKPQIVLNEGDSAGQRSTQQLGADGQQMLQVYIQQQITMYMLLASRACQSLDPRLLPELVRNVNRFPIGMPFEVDRTTLLSRDTRSNYLFGLKPDGRLAILFICQGFSYLIYPTRAKSGEYRVDSEDIYPCPLHPYTDRLVTESKHRGECLILCEATECQQDDEQGRCDVLLAHDLIVEHGKQIAKHVTFSQRQQRLADLLNFGSRPASSSSSSSIESPWLQWVHSCLKTRALSSSSSPSSSSAASEAAAINKLMVHVIHKPFVAAADVAKTLVKTLYLACDENKRRTNDDYRNVLQTVLSVNTSTPCVSAFDRLFDENEMTRAFLPVPRSSKFITFPVEGLVAEHKDGFFLSQRIYKWRACPTADFEISRCCIDDRFGHHENIPAIVADEKSRALNFDLDGMIPKNNRLYFFTLLGRNMDQDMYNQLRQTCDHGKSIVVECRLKNQNGVGEWVAVRIREDKQESGPNFYEIPLKILMNRVVQMKFTDIVEFFSNTSVGADDSTSISGSPNGKKNEPVAMNVEDLKPHSSADSSSQRLHENLRSLQNLHASLTGGVVSNGTIPQHTIVQAPPPAHHFDHTELMNQLNLLIPHISQPAAAAAAPAALATAMNIASGHNNNSNNGTVPNSSGFSHYPRSPTHTPPANLPPHGIWTPQMTMMPHPMPDVATLAPLPSMPPAVSQAQLHFNQFNPLQPQQRQPHLPYPVGIARGRFAMHDGNGRGGGGGRGRGGGGRGGGGFGRARGRGRELTMGGPGSAIMSSSSSADPYHMGKYPNGQNQFSKNSRGGMKPFVGFMPPPMPFPQQQQQQQQHQLQSHPVEQPAMMMMTDGDMSD